MDLFLKSEPFLGSGAFEPTSPPGYGPAPEAIGYLILFSTKIQYNARLECFKLNLLDFQKFKWFKLK